MAQISMCDRCGNMGLSTALGTIVYHTGPNTRTFTREVCPECVAEFLEFWENAPVRNPGVPFREEWQESPKEIESGEKPETVTERSGVQWRMPKNSEE